MKEFADSKKSKQKPRKGFPKKLHSINVTLPRQEYKKAFQKTIFRNTVKEIDYAKILIIVTTPRRYGNSNWLAIDFAKGAKESATPSQLYISTIKKSLLQRLSRVPNAEKMRYRQRQCRYRKNALLRSYSLNDDNLLLLHFRTDENND